MEINGCSLCLARHRRIGELGEQVKSLRRRLRYQQRKEQEGGLGIFDYIVQTNGEPKRERTAIEAQRGASRA
jgi:hypothetical protein